MRDREEAVVLVRRLWVMDMTVELVLAEGVAELEGPVQRPAAVGAAQVEVVRFREVVGAQVATEDTL